METRTIRPPEVDRSGTDMYWEQREAISSGDRPLPYDGLPRHWVDTVLRNLLVYDPDKVFLYGSVARGEDTIHSDIDLLVVMDRVPMEQWRMWRVRIRSAARYWCPYPVNVVLTDSEDLVRRRHIVTSPCKWVVDDGGRLLYDKHGDTADLSTIYSREEARRLLRRCVPIAG